MDIATATLVTSSLPFLDPVVSFVGTYLTYVKWTLVGLNSLGALSGLIMLIAGTFIITSS
jgi:hypothetical protein